MITSDGERHDLDWLIKPVDHEFFTHSHWTKKPLRINRQQPAYYSSLFSKEKIEHALAIACQMPGAVEVLDHNERPRRCRNYRIAREFFCKGESLRIDGVQRFSPELIPFCSTLEQALGCPVNINMYLSPGGAQALARHYDTHDVFVLQVYGQKKWRLFDSAVPFPLEYFPPLRCERREAMNHRRKSSKDLSAQHTCALTDEFVLASGDLLYLPRGYWHEAEAEPGHISCHLTVGPQCFTYLDLLMVAITQVALRDANLRTALPLGFVAQVDCRSIVTEQIASLMKTLPKEIDVEAALSEVGEVFARSRSSVERGLLQPILASPNQLELDSIVAVREGLLCAITLSQTDVSLVFGSRTISLPLAFEAAYRYMVGARSFTARELPGDLTDIEKVSLVRLLAEHGFLEAAGGGVARCKDEVTWPFAAQLPDELDGWLPVRLSLGPKKPEVEWLYFGQRKLSEPFFHQSVTRVKQAARSQPTKKTALDAVLHFKDEIGPSGFIFHVSRCGSTLAANALRAVPGTIVVSEPQPIAALLMQFVPESGTPALNGWKANRDELLRGILRAFGQRRNEDDETLIIKFPSWSILFLNLFRFLWPNVPCVVVVRDPVEVIVSCLQRPPGWMRFKRDPATASRIFGWSEQEVKEMTKEQFCARAIGQFIRAGAENVSPSCKVIDYEQLNYSRIIKIGEFFGLNVAHFDRELVEKSLSTYSKDSSGNRPFRDDRQRKQLAVTEAMRQESERWSNGVYAALKGQECW